MPEELRFDQLGSDRATVDGDHEPIMARAGLVDRPCQQLLAGPGLALDQDRNRAQCDPSGPGNDPLQDRALVNNRVDGWRGRRETGSEAGQLGIRAPEQVRDEVRRDLERDRDRPDADLATLGNGSKIRTPEPADENAVHAWMISISGWSAQNASAASVWLDVSLLNGCGYRIGWVQLDRRDHTGAVNLTGVSDR